MPKESIIRKRENILRNNKVLNDFISNMIEIKLLYKKTVNFEQKDNYSKENNFIFQLLNKLNDLKSPSFLSKNSNTEQTFKYYLQVIRKAARDGFNQNNQLANITLGKYLPKIRMLLLVYNNYINDIYERNSNRIDSMEKVVIFEACPFDQEEIDFSEEVNNLVNIFEKEDSLYFPIVRFGTTYNIFKNTCKTYTPRIIHFICHGGYDHLCLLKLTGETLKFKSNIFLNFFENDYSKDKDLFLVYFNSCNSDLFASEVRSFKRKNVHFYKTIGYAGANNNFFAIIYSERFYYNFYNDSEHNVCLATKKTKQWFIEKYCNNYTSKICVCKR